VVIVVSEHETVTLTFKALWKPVFPH